MLLAAIPYRIVSWNGANCLVKFSGFYDVLLCDDAFKIIVMAIDRGLGIDTHNHVLCFWMAERPGDCVQHVCEADCGGLSNPNGHIGGDRRLRFLLLNSIGVPSPA